ncbi:MAG TPA: response regulator transcription factor [Methylomirabilota bacterium]|jgi:DNA-binding NarL/FixJ family response regulator
MPRTLVIVGLDPTFRRRLGQSLQAELQSRVHEFAARSDVQARVAALQPSLILFDLGAKPNAPAVEMVSTLSAVSKTVALAGVDDDELALQALKAGARGFCARGTAPALLRKAVEVVEAGEIWVRRRVMMRLIEELASPRAPEVRSVAGENSLTTREREIATLVARGAGNKEIAGQLTISIKTVKAHLTNIFKKLGLETRLQLALAMGAEGSARTKVG